jgi:hypothetical protein
VTGQRREQLRLLTKALFAAAGVVLVLGVIGAIQVATAEEDFLLGNLQRQSRGPLALGAVAGGVFAAGVLAALGGIITILLDRDNAE